MGFLFPTMLWLGCLAVPLVALYILKVRRHDERVSTTWLWETSLREVEAQIPFRRLRRDWLLLLQLLILALLVLAAASPFRRSLVAPGGQVAIVLDASAGMLAEERFEDARRAALRVLDGLGPSDQALVVRAGAQPETLAPLTPDRRALREAVASTFASPAPCDLDAALRLARRVLGESGTIVLLTDGTSSFTPQERLQVVSVGTKADNVGITALSVRPADATGTSHEVFVRMRNASPETAEGRLTLEVDGRVRDAASLRIGPEQEGARTLRLEGVRQGILDVFWTSESPDALPEDDAAQWVLRPREPRRYRFLGSPDSYLRRALESDHDWVPARGGESPDLEIVVRRVPSETGPPFLWIDPPEGREKIAPGAVVLDWDRAHPVLRFLDLHPVRLGNVPKLKRPPGGRVLAESSAGPMLIEGSRGERPYLLWGFDPMQTDLPLRAAFPLLVRNSLEHLAPPDRGIPGGVASGSSPEIPWPWTGEPRLVSPHGRQTPLAFSGGRVRLPPLEEEGVWRLTAEGQELPFAVSLLDPDESDLRAAAVDGRGFAPESLRRDAELRTSLRGLWRPLVLAGLIFLLLESAAFFRRWVP